MKAALKKLEEEEKRASMLLKMDERKRPYNSMTETKVGRLTTPFSKYFLLKRQGHKIFDLRVFSTASWFPLRLLRFRYFEFVQKGMEIFSVFCHNMLFHLGWQLDLVYTIIEFTIQ